MTKEMPAYYAILTANVRYDEDLTDSEKILYAEITALAEKSGQCWASNGYFARLYGVSSNTISRRINKLRRLGHISVEILYKEGTKEVDKRIIIIDHGYYQRTGGGIITNDDTPSQECRGGIITNDDRGIIRNGEENTTSINTTSITSPLTPPKGGGREKGKLDLSKIPTEFSVDSIEEYISYRAKIKQPITQRALNRVLKVAMQVAGEINETPDEVLAICQTRGWRGCEPWFFDDYRKNSREAESAPQTDPNELMRRIKKEREDMERKKGVKNA